VSGIAKWLYRHSPQEVCPWNVKFARALAEKILLMDDVAYRDAFRGRTMKRAKLEGLRRNASVVLENAS
jgi:epoxyqueuosine reductase QueG